MGKPIDDIARSFMKLLPLLYTKLTEPDPHAQGAKKPSELTHLQLHILEQLYQTEQGSSVTQLADSLRISKQQLTPLLQKLEQKGYLLKRKDETDRRAVKLLLTEQGGAEASGRWAELYKLLCERLDKLDEEQLEDLNFAAGKMVRILDRLP
ncbi:MarR family transcriptional regulator [Paenibacillus athensensis]|uniref:HTH marR-type domain-containing protein n=1 Tax=Paenibacillus athensensis TaxID=1967502 RepID=A0A4Y8Q5G1_9BACL|nr:MarR family transcriptional regulator [Paenibacillus athensensis]MCD1259506.1 MarR family transcriptional regulator [Paenibacillus athensensis]